MCMGGKATTQFIEEKALELLNKAYDFKLLCMELIKRLLENIRVSSLTEKLVFIKVCR